jgi:L-amino acid N-acyltransferase YncA
VQGAGDTKAIKLLAATAAELPVIVHADTEPISIESRLSCCHKRDPLRRSIWVTEENGEVAGGTSPSPFYDGRPACHVTAEIGVYVSEKYRRKGWGRRLVEEAIRRGPVLGIKIVTAGAFAHKEPSIELFEGLGFERWAHFPNLAKFDGI